MPGIVCEITITTFSEVDCSDAGCFLLHKCDNDSMVKDVDMIDRNAFKQGRLTAKPWVKEFAEQATGVQALGLDAKRDGFIYVPRGYNKDTPAALALMLHGAGGEAEHGLQILRQYSDENDIILLAPASRWSTWDIIMKESFDTDVIFINQALNLVFTRYHINPNRIAVGGFSDGASYALCIGLSNGDLFTHIIAFSPGFYYTFKNEGKPAVFISHGTNDGILPINPCSRRIVPHLQKLGYKVDYKEFVGEHEIPLNISHNAIEWFQK